MLLPKEEADIFHSVVYILLYVAIRARRDLQPSVAFLSTRVNKPTQQDDVKLRRVLGYVASTLDEVSYIGINEPLTMIHFIDASYAIHNDFKGHTGAGSTLGIAVISSQSSKQKLVTRSSTESELVAVADRLPKNMDAI